MKARKGFIKVAQWRPKSQPPGMRFKIRKIDPYLLGKARRFCEDRGTDFNRFLEAAVRDAIEEVRARERMENGVSHLHPCSTMFTTQDPELLKVIELSESPLSKWDSRGFDAVITRMLQRRLTLCEANLLSLR
jgi:hypothetical protein